MDFKKYTINMPAAQYRIKCPFAMVPECIVVHNTANDAPAVNEIKYMQSNDKQVSFHYAVDDKEVVQGVPLTRNAWHAGDGGDGKGNRKGIAIEICYSKSGGDRFVKAEKNAAQLIAFLLDTYGWGIDRVTKHQDYSGKYCPHRTLDMGWERFLRMVDSYRDGKEGTVVRKEDYTVGQLRVVLANHPRLVYLDAAKNKIPGKNACNADFFGNYKRGRTSYTLPRGNLVCDMGVYQVPEDVRQDLEKHIGEGKLWYGCLDNAADSQFRNKSVATLFIPKVGNAYITDTNMVPDNVKYAVSGVPCIRKGNDVDWYNYVTRQGWPADTVRNTYHNWLGVRNGEVWVITGQSKAKSGNMIYGMWFWDLMKDEKFDDVIKLDGGGSYFCRIGGKLMHGSSGNRHINAYFAWY